MVDWDEYFLRMCKTVSIRSKDPATKLGSVIVRDRRILTAGYNGFPAKVEEEPERWQRPTKYDFVVHAEQNAIAHAARFGVAIEGATIYTLLKPCKDCARLIAAAGLGEVRYSLVYTIAYDARSPHNPHGFNVGDTILREAFINVIGV